MKLDRTTYEAWLLDRIEGRLTPAQERELDAFLAANPDLSADTTGLPTLESCTPKPIDWKDDLRKRLPPTGMPDAARLNEFLVARMEGDLNAEQEAALMKFLYEHPEFEQDANRIRASRADNSPVPFTEKPSIERNFPPRGMPDKHRLTDFLIAAQEGDLDRAQQQALDALLAHDPDAKKAQRIIAVSKVHAEHIVFPDKAGLKKREARVISLWQRYAVAASIALLLGLAWWMLDADGGMGPERNGPSVAGTVSPSAQEPGKTNTEHGVHQPEEALPIPDNGSNAGSTINPGGTRRQSEDGNTAKSNVKRAGGGAPDEHEGTPDSQRQVSSPPASAPLQLPAPEQQLAGTPGAVPVPERSPVEPLTTTEPLLAANDKPANEAPLSAASSPGVGIPVGTALANAVRGKVLDAPDRSHGLDQRDALAMANRALGAITGGEGRVDVATNKGRRAWKLRLGPGLAIAASTTN